MGVSENVRLTTAFQDAYNARDWEALRGTLAESVVVHDPGEPEPFRGRDSVLQMFEQSAAFFPTSRIEGVHQFGQADQVCVENVETAPERTPTSVIRFRPATRSRSRTGSYPRFASTMTLWT